VAFGLLEKARLTGALIWVPLKSSSMISAPVVITRRSSQR